MPTITRRAGRPSSQRHASLTRRRQRIANATRVAALRTTQEPDQSTSHHLHSIPTCLQELGNNLQYNYCGTCKERWLSMTMARNDLCSRCSRQPIKFSAANDMDPGEVPDALKDLNDTEEQLIGRVKAICSITKLKGGGQYSYSGSVINFVQDTNEFAKCLPHHPSTASTMLIAKGTHKDRFKVSVPRIRTALLWLKVNNPYYADVEIAEDVLTAMEGVGGDIGDLLPQIDLDLNTAQDDFIHESGVASHVNIPQETLIRAALNANQPIEQPMLSNEPINEYTTNGYVVMAFPTLFPTGRADLRDTSGRRIKVDPIDYFTHLFKYDDGRFAKHPRFRFFAMNSNQRWRTATQGKVLVSRAGLGDLTVKQLKDRMVEQPTLIKQIGFFNANLRTSSAFWFKRSAELLDMVNQLGPPTIFFTLSSADLHWKELWKLLAPDVVDHSILTCTQRYSLIRENPQVVDYFFTVRGEHYVKQQMKEQFNITDHWFRFEYQHRGSIHLHGLAWIKDAPDITQLDSMSASELQGVIEFFDALSTEEHPDVNVRPPIVHPCKLSPSDISDVDHDYAELCSIVEIHSTCGVHCMRKPKGGGSERCRYKFPKDLQERTTLTKIDGSWVLTQRRNHPRVNRHNRSVLQTWRANIDFTPIVSTNAVCGYIAKYASKCEPQSTTLAELMCNILTNEVSDDDSAKKAITKLLMKTVSGRDHCAQECAHVNLGLPFWSSTREFVALVIPNSDSEEQVLLQTLNDDEVIGGTKSLIEKYKNRNAAYSHLSLFDFSSQCKVVGDRYTKRRKAAVVRVFPRLKLIEENDADNDMYYRIQVLVHVPYPLPWISEADFLGDMTSKSLFEARQITQQLDLEPLHEDDEFEDEDFELYVDGQDPFMLMAQIGPAGPPSDVDLGLRAMDIEHDWSSSYGHFEEPELLSSFLIQSRQQTEMVAEHQVYPDVQFTHEQQNVLFILDSQMQGSAIHNRIIIQGKAGTGKSTLIRAIVAKLTADLNYGSSSYKLLAPTGAASVNINGQTIHSVLKISGKFNPLTNEALTAFQRDFESVKVIIIDEWSMVGSTLMGQVEQRCRQAKGCDEPFGGMIVYLLGDIKQLPPVGDKPMYAKKKPGRYSSSLSDQGQLAYKKHFTKAVILKEAHRQLGTSTTDVHFRDALDKLSIGRNTEEDWQLFMSRSTSRVCVAEQSTFKDALRIYSTKQEVMTYNTEKLRSLDLPVARIQAKHNSKNAEKATTNDAQGLAHTLKLSVGALVILTRNLWTDKKLVNGARGEVKDIVYRPTDNAQTAMPVAVLIKFDKYTGPTVDGCVPIAPITSGYQLGGESCTRMQLPLKLAWAITAHASQGQTIDKAVIGIGNTEFAAGLSYVMFSRIRSLQGLLVEPFPYSRISHIHDSDRMKQRVEAEKCLQKLSEK